MSNIEFDDNAQSLNPSTNNVLYSRIQKSADRPNMVNFLMKKGLIKSENSANALLLSIAAIFFLSAVLLIYFYFFYTPASSKRNNAPSGIVIMQKTNEYITQGMSPEDARKRATEDFYNQN